MKYFIERLDEASTWRGIIMLATAFGVQLEPEQTEAIVSFGLAVVGLLGVFSKDKTDVKIQYVTDEK